MHSPRTPFEQSELTRREFLAAATRNGLILVLAAERNGVVGRLLAHGPPHGTPLAPNQWVAVDQTGLVTVTAYKSEMGQGVRTSLPAILIAELGADWNHVRVVHAEPGPGFPDMGTSGSGSIEDSWRMLRRAAAAARLMLTSAAAAQWGVASGDCVALASAIVHRPSGRKLTFGALVAAAADLPVPATPELRPDSELELLGGRLRRVDTPAIVRGRAEYGIDVRVPGMRFAVLARPPVSGAVLSSFDERAARAVAGVTDVVRVPGGVAVVASNSWSAMRGREALATSWTDAERPDVTTATMLAALRDALPHGKVSRREGDIGDAFERAARTIEATYQMPAQAHAAIEPLTCVADVRRDACEVWVGTQRPNGVKKAAAEICGLPEEKVRVHVVLMGGAFGRRIAIDHAREAIEISRAIARPVQLLWTREDDFLHDMYQPPQVNQISAAIGASNEILGWRQRVADYHLTMFGPRDPSANPADDGDPWGAYDSPYVFPAFDVTLAVLDPPVPTGAWRSVTYPGGVFARESFVDELAHATGRDPLQLRIELLSATPGVSPRRNAARTAERLTRVLRVAAQRVGWANRSVRVERGRHRALGLACNPYHGDGAMVAQIADVSVGAAGDIRVHRVTTAIDVGRVIDRSGLEAQVQGGVAWALTAALKTEMPIANGRATATTFAQYPVARMRDMPEQDIVIVESEQTPYGAGEPPVPAVYAAVANAVFAATGQRVRATPIRLPRGDR